MSLSDKLAELTLDISDKSKTIDLLKNIISQQQGRHAVEISKFEKEMEESLKKASTEKDEALQELFKTNQELPLKKKALESRVEELAVEKQQVESSKKASIEAIRKELADAKEREHKLHQQENEQREKAWFDKRVSEIEQMTLKGIQPTIDRLMRKHKEDCEEIACNTQLSKQKLQVQSENELMTRIQEFQQSEQQARSSITSRNDFAHALLAEQNDHVARMKKLKESLVEEETNAKNLHEIELQTLTKQHEAELAKVKRKTSNNAHHLEQNLQSKMEQRRYELDYELEEIDRGLAASKTEWEESYRKTATDRVAKQKELKKKELLAWRETQINNLIRASVVEQATLESEMEGPNETELATEHAKEMESLRKKLHSAQQKNNEIKAKITSIGESRVQLQSSLIQLERELDAASIKLDDLVARKEREQRKHNEMIQETSLQIERSLETMRRRKAECQLEIDRIKESITDQTSVHNTSKAELQREHEQKLDDLQQHATEAASELDRKLLRLNTLIKEKGVYLSKAQNLLSTRYDK